MFFFVLGVCLSTGEHIVIKRIQIHSNTRMTNYYGIVLPTEVVLHMVAATAAVLNGSGNNDNGLYVQKQIK